MPSFGFIVLRHVNSEATNRYWNQCVKLLRMHYPHVSIVIIDDNSNQSCVSSFFEYKNITVVQSEYPKRGELLPYIYYLRHRWFESAVIIHDSTFIHRRIPFENIHAPVLPLWHFQNDQENLPNLMRISSRLKNNFHVAQRLKKTTVVMGMGSDITGCFGVQSIIQHNFLVKMNKMFNLPALIPVITCRVDRCALERIMAAMFHIAYPQLHRLRSAFGFIHNHHKAFSYKYDEYEEDFRAGIVRKPIIKVWTGR
jgi:hypothetical protein